MIIIPEAFQRDTIAREGEAGRRWIGTLPQVVAERLAHWRLERDGPVAHGYLGLILPVRRGNDVYILKVSWVDRWTAHEGLALETWAGRGAVMLIDQVPGCGALLLERADAGYSLEDAPIAEALDVAGMLLRRLAIVAPPGVRTFPEELQYVAEDLRAGRTQQGRPFSAGLLARAVTAAASASPSATLLVNTDLHYGNILRATREPWLAIDPKVVAGELKYGVAPLLWSRFNVMGGARGFASRFATLVQKAELDPQAAHQWTLLRVLEYWLWALGQGLTEDAQRCRLLVEWLLDQERLLTTRCT